MDRMNIIVKRAMLEVLEELYVDLETMEKNTNRKWGKTGAVEQSKKWNKETREYDLEYDEDGNPVMEEVYDYIPKTDSDYDDTDRAKLSAVETVKKALDKLI